MAIDVRRVLIFREVARAGSISAAARALGWTQPAVSQHLRALERQTGAALLLRGPGGVELTEPGRVLLARADLIAGQLHLADEELAALGDLRRGLVRLAAYPSAAAAIVPAAMARMVQRHPDVDVTLTEAEPPEATRLLASGEADVALVFAYLCDDDLEVGLRWSPIVREPVDLVLPAGHPLAAEPVVELADLADESWVFGGARCREHVVRLCERAGFAPRVRHSTDDYVVAQSLVAAGLGVALLPRSTVEVYHHPGVVARQGAAYGSRTVGVVHREGAELVPATAAVLQQLRHAAFRDLVADSGS